MNTIRPHMNTIRACVVFLFTIAIGISSSNAQSRSGDADALQLSCAPEEVFFDQACRVFDFFLGLTPRRAELLEVQGCREVSLTSPGCGNAAQLTEKAPDGRIRMVTILSPAAWNSLSATRRQPSAQRDLAVRSRGPYPIGLRTIVEVTPMPAGEVLFEQTTEAFAPARPPLLLVDLAFELAESDSSIRNPSYDVVGEICFENADMFLQSTDEPADCSCIDEGTCGLGWYRGESADTESSLHCTGETCRMCTRMSEYSDIENGIVRTEVELLLTRGRSTIAGFARDRQSSVGVRHANCWQAEGYSYAGVLQTTSDAASGFSSTCGPDINSAINTLHTACRYSAAVAGLRDEIADLVEITGGVNLGGGLSSTNPIGVTGDVNIQTTGVDGQPISIANLAAQQTSMVQDRLSPGNVADQMCGHMSSGLASAEYMSYFCEDGIGNKSCAGSHANVPVTVTAQNGAKCNAVANLQCSGPDSDTTLLSPECTCEMTGLQVDESSCR